MESVELDNGLTDKERISVLRLLGHDTTGILSRMRNRVHILNRTNVSPSDKDPLKFFIDHVSSIHRAIDVLAYSEKISLFERCGNDGFLEEKDLVSRFNLLGVALTSLGLGSIELKVNSFHPFLAPTDVLYAMHFNLAKNALAAQSSVDGNVCVEVNSYLDFSRGALFVPDGAEKYKKFIEFKFSNRGEFPKGKNLRDYLVGPEPAKDSRGFGLYFVGLAARVLKTPINIQSREGETIVSVYHPVY